MFPVIGGSVLYKNKIMKVQDKDNINQEALCGVSDTNGIVWDSCWIHWDFLTKIEKDQK